MPSPTSRGYLRALGSDNWRTYLKTSLAATLDLLDADVGDLSANAALLDTLLAGLVHAAAGDKWRLGTVGLAIGPSVGDPSSYLVVTHAFGPPTVGAVLVDVGLDTTSTDPASDQGAGRFVARQAASGQTLIRALETHVVRDGAALAAGTWGIELGVHSKVAGNGANQNVGLRVDSSSAGWLTGAGARNDAALHVMGANGWHHALYYQDTDASVLVDIDEFGKITCRAVVLAAAGSLVDFSGQVTGNIRGGTGTFNVQSADGLNNNLALTNAGAMTVRASVTTPALTVTGALTKGTVPLNQVLVQALANAAVAAASTNYSVFGAGSAGTVENTRQAPLPRAGTVRNLYVVTGGAQPGDGTLVATIRKNGVDTAVTLTVAAGAAAGTFSDLTHSVAFAAGDLVGLKLVNGSPGTASAPIIGWGVTFDA